MNALTARTRWRAADASGLEWRDWDGEVVAWVERTGSTHLLSAVASAVFATLATQPQARSAHELSEILFDDEPSPTDSGVALDNVLLELQDLGLVRPQPV